MIKKFLWLVSLLALFCLSAAVVVEGLYSSVAADIGAHTHEQHQQLADNLASVNFQSIPVGLVATASAAHLKAAQSHADASQFNRQVLLQSPLNTRQWFQWLDNSLQLSPQSVSSQQLSAAVVLLHQTAANEVWLRLAMSRLALVEWYQLSPELRVAFRQHLDWMVRYNAEMLWGHAHLVRRTALLCRIYATDEIRLPLC